MELRANQLREGDVLWIHRLGRRVRVRGVWGNAAGRIVVATDRTRYVLEPRELVRVEYVAARNDDETGVGDMDEDRCASCNVLIATVIDAGRGDGVTAHYSPATAESVTAWTCCESCAMALEHELYGCEDCEPPSA